MAPPRLRASREVVEFAREQRKSGNLAEVALWRALRERPGGYKFRKQHPEIGRLSLDFICLSAMLCVEVDGEIHGRGDQPEKDERRDVRVEQMGYAVLRIPARVVLSDLNSAIEAIVAACGARAAPPPPRPNRRAANPSTTPASRRGPPPRSGEV